MKAIKALFFAILLAMGLFVGWLFMPAQTTLDKQVLDAPLSVEPFKLVGYRSISTDPEVDSLYHYFVIIEGTDIKQIEPFLITSDPFVRLESSDENTLLITVNGKIERYTNDLWIEKSDGMLHHWYVSANAGYVR